LEYEKKLTEKQVEGLWTATLDREGLELVNDDDFPNFD
jgi:hypothetical protein